MYTPPFFKQDRAASLKFADTRGFGTICAFDGHKPIASPLPFYLTYAADGTPQAAFHVARHNPLLKLADGTTSWLSQSTALMLTCRRTGTSRRIRCRPGYTSRSI